MSTNTNIVIGSGPSGVSAATALLARGAHVTLIDGGKTLEADLAAKATQLGDADPSSWTEDNRAAYFAGQFEAPDGAIRKFGSDFAIEPAERTFSDASDWFALRASYARGGLSNLWGASVLPSRQSDIDDWPIDTAQLEPHYKAVSQFMPVAAQVDDLSEFYPAFDPVGRTPLPFNPQADQLLSRLGTQRDALNHMGIYFGAARNAVNAGCKMCGMCLHGCPYGLIYTASQTLEALRSHENFTYLPGKLVSSFEETGDGVTVATKDGDVVKGARLYIGAGVLETARIMLASLEALDTLTLKDSQHFFTPGLHRWRISDDPEAAPHHTLTGAFIEFDNAEISERVVHSQLYTWNEFYAREMRAKYEKILPFSSRIIEFLSKRLIVAQTFLHSDQSGEIDLKLGAGAKLAAENRPNREVDRHVARARRHLSAGLRKAGVHTLGFAGHIGQPGSSFHVGGSLPMGQLTDPLGRPTGLSRVHVVDASVLPSIPASTITYTVMANAHRIGSARL